MAIFQDGGRPILKLRMRHECRTASPCQILWRLSKPLPRYRGFRFFEMAAAVILDFKNLNFFTVSTVKKVELRHCAKCCRNASNQGRDIATFRFFEMAAATL